LPLADDLGVAHVVGILAVHFEKYE